jgi:hypothetical protein
LFVRAFSRRFALFRDILHLANRFFWNSASPAAANTSSMIKILGSRNAVTATPISTVIPELYL